MEAKVELPVEEKLEDTVALTKVLLPVAVKAPEILVAAATLSVPDTLVVPVSVPSFIEVAMVEPLLPPPEDTGTYMY